MKFKTKELKKIGLPYSAILDEMVESTRWSIIHRIVFQFNDKFYETHYSIGATEMQYESPWEYETEIEATEVELVEVRVQQWKPVKKDLNEEVINFIRREN